jgi:hypothetical protein
MVSLFICLLTSSVFSVVCICRMDERMKKFTSNLMMVKIMQFHTERTLIASEIMFVLN